MLTDVPPLTIWAIPVFLLAVGAEAWMDARDGAGGYQGRDAAASVTMGLGRVVMDLVWKSASLAVYTAVFTLTPLRMGWGWMAWVAVAFADDVAYYWFHRLHHEVRLFWASHVPHHSSQKYNLTTALRQTWTPWTGLLFWLPLAALGFHPIMIMTMQAVSLLYQFGIHTERVDRLWAPIELVFNTPSHHRVHHGSNAEYLDKNYAGILIVWDRLFGTFEAEDAPVRYGLTRNINTYNPVRIALHEFADIARDVARPNPLSTRLGYVFRGPGWAYDQRERDAAPALAQA